MPKARYNVSLLFRGSNDPVQGFIARVQEFGPGGTTLFKDKKVHEGGDRNPLPIELDRVMSPATGIAKLTIVGPATGVEGDPVTYETNLYLRRDKGGDIVFRFADCPNIDKPKAIPPVSTTEAPIPPVPDLDEVFAEMFLARDAAERGVDSARDKLLELAERNHLDLRFLSDEWYGRLDLDCATIRVHIDDAGSPATLDAKAQLRYYGAQRPLNVPKKISHDFKRPTVIRARASNGRVRLDIEETAGAGRHFTTEIDLSVGVAHNVVVVPVEAHEPKLHKQYIDAPDKILHSYVDGSDRGRVDPVFIKHGEGDKLHSSLAHSIWLECEKFAKDWAYAQGKNVRDARLICLWSRSFLTFELADTGYYQWQAFRWTEENGRGELIDQDVRVERLYVEWFA